MNTDFAREMIPIWSSTEQIPLRMQLNERRDRFIKRYGIFLVLMCAWTISLIICSAIVHHNTEKAVWEEARAEYAVQLEQYKAEQREREQASYFLSGDASREAAMNQDAESLAHDGGVWKTENAFKAYCANVKIRTLRADYPNSVKEVLSQPGQYDFYSPDGTYSKEKFDWAKEVLESMQDGELPRYLTIDHQYLEMKNGGTDCVLHTSFPLYTSNDDPWRWQ